MANTLPDGQLIESENRSYDLTFPTGEPEERLARQGLISMAEQTQELAQGILSSMQGSPCMLAELSCMHEEVLERTPETFVIKEVSREAEGHDFKNVFIETYEIPDWVDATLQIGIG